MPKIVKKNISVIPPKQEHDRSVRPQFRTLQKQQETSYEAQVSYYTEKIKSNPNWKLAGIFADDGKSATSTKKRGDF